MAFWHIFRIAPPEPEPEVDPLDAVLAAIDHLNTLVPTLPRELGLWIDYTPGGRRGTVILRKKQFAESVQIYPEREVERAERKVRARAKK